ncbi:MAG: hypothetical protein ACLQIB_11850 [Isosphaeraceae bacterium]
MTILQVLLFRNTESSRELGPALWAATKEVESLFNLDQPRMTFRRAYLALDVPVAIRGEVEGDLPAIKRALEDTQRWDQTRGKFNRTYDQDQLAAFAREVLGDRAAADFLTLITDVEITPPRGWRYIIWDGYPNGSVVSLAPIDPEYWGIRDPQRTMTIKQRLRAACCSIVGACVGLGECVNARCFRYNNVDSVTVLDQMVYLGGEHKVTGLTRRGFATTATDPAATQEIIQYPTSMEAGD